MLILPQKTTMKWNPANKKYYESKGYIYTKTGNEFEIDILDLPENSKHKVKYICDYCGNESEAQFTIVKPDKKINFNYDLKNCCKKCMSKKRKEINLEKYGVESYFQTNECKEKVKQTNLEKYGVENVFQAEEIKDKIKQTNLEKYGVNYSCQAEEIKEKIKQTNLERHGIEYCLKLPEIHEKIKQTNLEKYGVENVFQAEEIKDKIKQTNLEKYGVEYYSQTKEYIKKVKQTNLQRYGVDHLMKIESFKNFIICKANQTMYKNGTTLKSIQQIYICNLLNGELNYPIDRSSLDIAFPNEMIYIEYDGGGHGWYDKRYTENGEQVVKQRDLRRTAYLKNKGWKLIRIISNKDWIPQDEDIIQLINEAKQYLLNSNHSWLEIDIDKKEIRCAEYIKKIELNNLRKIRKSDL